MSLSPLAELQDDLAKDEKRLIDLRPLFKPLPLRPGFLHTLASGEVHKIPLRKKEGCINLLLVEVRVPSLLSLSLYLSLSRSLYLSELLSVPLCFFFFFFFFLSPLMNDLN